MQENNKDIAAKSTQATDAPVPTGKKHIENGKMKKKQWRIKSKDGGTVLNFYPIFEVNEELKQVECRYLEMEFEFDGKKKVMTFDWLNIYMFIYYTCNEELRMGLAQRYERKVNYIPYDVEIPLTPEDRTAPTLKRRIELPIDELTMAIARNEAMMLLRRQLAKGHKLDPRDFMYKGRRK